jgi:hypothetical protein
MPRERRVPISAILAALPAAGIQSAKRSLFLSELDRQAPKRGRKEEPDAAMLARVEELAEKGVTIYAACGTVSNGSKAVRKRLYRKAMKAKAAQEDQARTLSEEFRTRLDEAEAAIPPTRQVFVYASIKVLVDGAMKQLIGPGVFSLPEKKANALIELGLAEDHPK